MNFMLLLDNKMADLMSSFKPHYTVMGMSEPGGFGSNIEHPKPVMSTVSNWLRGG